MIIVVSVTQLVEYQIVALKVPGSNPGSYPIFYGMFNPKLIFQFCRLRLLRYLLV